MAPRNQEQAQNPSPEDNQSLSTTPNNDINRYRQVFRAAAAEVERNEEHHEELRDRMLDGGQEPTIQRTNATRTTRTNTQRASDIVHDARQTEVGGGGRRRSRRSRHGSIPTLKDMLDEYGIGEDEISEVIQQAIEDLAGKSGLELSGGELMNITEQIAQHMSLTLANGSLEYSEDLERVLYKRFVEGDQSVDEELLNLVADFIYQEASQESETALRYCLAHSVYAEEMLAFADKINIQLSADPTLVDWPEEVALLTAAHYYENQEWLPHIEQSGIQAFTFDLRRAIQMTSGVQIDSAQAEAIAKCIIAEQFRYELRPQVTQYATESLQAWYLQTEKPSRDQFLAPYDSVFELIPNLKDTIIADIYDVEVEITDYVERESMRYLEVVQDIHRLTELSEMNRIGMEGEHSLLQYLLSMDVEAYEQFIDVYLAEYDCEFQEALAKIYGEEKATEIHEGLLSGDEEIRFVLQGRVHAAAVGVDLAHGEDHLTRFHEFFISADQSLISRYERFFGAIDFPFTVIPEPSVSLRMLSNELVANREGDQSLQIATDIRRKLESLDSHDRHYYQKRIILLTEELQQHPLEEREAIADHVASFYQDERTAYEVRNNQTNWVIHALDTNSTHNPHAWYLWAVVEGRESYEAAAQLAIIEREEYRSFLDVLALNDEHPGIFQSANPSNENAANPQIVSAYQEITGRNLDWGEQVQFTRTSFEDEQVEWGDIPPDIVAARRTLLWNMKNGEELNQVALRKVLADEAARIGREEAEVLADYHHTDTAHAKRIVAHLDRLYLLADQLAVDTERTQFTVRLAYAEARQRELLRQFSLEVWSMGKNQRLELGRDTELGCDPTDEHLEALERFIIEKEQLFEKEGLREALTAHWRRAFDETDDVYQSMQATAQEIFNSLDGQNMFGRGRFWRAITKGVCGSKSAMEGYSKKCFFTDLELRVLRDVFLDYSNGETLDSWVSREFRFFGSQTDFYHKEVEPAFAVANAIEDRRTSREIENLDDYYSSTEGVLERSVESDDPAVKAFEIRNTLRSETGFLELLALLNDPDAALFIQEYEWLYGVTLKDSILKEFQDFGNVIIPPHMRGELGEEINEKTLVVDLIQAIKAGKTPEELGANLELQSRIHLILVTQLKKYGEEVGELKAGELVLHGIQTGAEVRVRNDLILRLEEKKDRVLELAGQFLGDAQLENLRQVYSDTSTVTYQNHFLQNYSELLSRIVLSEKIGVETILTSNRAVFDSYMQSQGEQFSMSIEGTQFNLEEYRTQLLTDYRQEYTVLYREVIKAATDLNGAMDNYSPWPDKEKIKETLRGLSGDDARSLLMDVYQIRYGKDLEGHIRDEIDGEEAVLSLSYLRGDHLFAEQIQTGLATEYWFEWFGRGEGVIEDSNRRAMAILLTEAREELIEEADELDRLADHKAAIGDLAEARELHYQAFALRDAANSEPGESETLRNKCSELEGEYWSHFNLYQRYRELDRNELLDQVWDREKLEAIMIQNSDPDKAFVLHLESALKDNSNEAIRLIEGEKQRILGDYLTANVQFDDAGKLNTEIRLVEGTEEEKLYIDGEEVTEDFIKSFYVQISIQKQQEVQAQAGENGPQIVAQMQAQLAEEMALSVRELAEHRFHIQMEGLSDAQVLEAVLQHLLTTPQISDLDHSERTVAFYRNQAIEDTLGVELSFDEIGEVVYEYDEETGYLAVAGQEVTFENLKNVQLQFLQQLHDATPEESRITVLDEDGNEVTVNHREHLMNTIAYIEALSLQEFAVEVCSLEVEDKSDLEIVRDILRSFAKDPQSGRIPDERRIQLFEDTYSKEVLYPKYALDIADGSIFDEEKHPDLVAAWNDRLDELNLVVEAVVGEGESIETMIEDETYHGVYRDALMAELNCDVYTALACRIKLDLDGKGDGDTLAADALLPPYALSLLGDIDNERMVMLATLGSVLQHSSNISLSVENPLEVLERGTEAEREAERLKYLIEKTTDTEEKAELESELEALLIEVQLAKDLQAELLIIFPEGSQQRQACNDLITRYQELEAQGLEITAAIRTRSDKIEEAFDAAGYNMVLVTTSDGSNDSSSTERVERSMWRQMEIDYGTSETGNIRHAVELGELTPALVIKIGLGDDGLWSSQKEKLLRELGDTRHGGEPKTLDELIALAEDFCRVDGEPNLTGQAALAHLKDRVLWKVSGDDQWKVEVLFIGKPQVNEQRDNLNQTARQMVQIVNIHHGHMDTLFNRAYENKEWVLGGTANALDYVDDLYVSEHERFMEQYDAFEEKIIALGGQIVDGEIYLAPDIELTEEDLRELKDIFERVDTNVDAAVQERNAIANTAEFVISTTVVVVGSTVILVASGGTATPLLLAGFAVLAAGSRLGVKYVMKGGSYSTTEATVDGGMVFVDVASLGASGLITNGLRKASYHIAGKFVIRNSMKKASQITAKTATQTTAKTTIQEGAEATVVNAGRETIESTTQQTVVQNARQYAGMGIQEAGEQFIEGPGLGKWMFRGLLVSMDGSIQGGIDAFSVGTVQQGLNGQNWTEGFWNGVENMFVTGGQQSILGFGLGGGLGGGFHIVGGGSKLLARGAEYIPVLRDFRVVQWLAKPSHAVPNLEGHERFVSEIGMEGTSTTLGRQARKDKVASAMLSKGDDSLTYRERANLEMDQGCLERMEQSVHAANVKAESLRRSNFTAKQTKDVIAYRNAEVRALEAEKLLIIRTKQLNKLPKNSPDYDEALILLTRAKEVAKELRIVAKDLRAKIIIHGKIADQLAKIGADQPTPEMCRIAEAEVTATMEMRRCLLVLDLAGVAKNWWKARTAGRNLIRLHDLNIIKLTVDARLKEFDEVQTRVNFNNLDDQVKQFFTEIRERYVIILRETVTQQVQRNRGWTNFLSLRGLPHWRTIFQPRRMRIQQRQVDDLHRTFLKLEWIADGIRETKKRFETCNISTDNVVDYYMAVLRRDLAVEARGVSVSRLFTDIITLRPFRATQDAYRIVVNLVDGIRCQRQVRSIGRNINESRYYVNALGDLDVAIFGDVARRYAQLSVVLDAHPITLLISPGHYFARLRRYRLGRILESARRDKLLADVAGISLDESSKNLFKRLRLDDRFKDLADSAESVRTAYLQAKANFAHRFKNLWDALIAGKIRENLTRRGIIRDCGSALFDLVIVTGKQWKCSVKLKVAIFTLERESLVNLCKKIVFTPRDLIVSGYRKMKQTMTDTRLAIAELTDELRANIQRLRDMRAGIRFPRLLASLSLPVRGLSFTCNVLRLSGLGKRFSDIADQLSGVLIIRREIDRQLADQIRDRARLEAMAYLGYEGVPNGRIQGVIDNYANATVILETTPWYRFIKRALAARQLKLAKKELGWLNLRTRSRAYAKSQTEKYQNTYPNGIDPKYRDKDSMAVVAQQLGEVDGRIYRYQERLIHADRLTPRELAETKALLKKAKQERRLLKARYRSELRIEKLAQKLHQQLGGGDEALTVAMQYARAIEGLRFTRYHDLAIELNRGRKIENFDYDAYYLVYQEAIANFKKLKKGAKRLKSIEKRLEKSPYYNPELDRSTNPLVNDLSVDGLLKDVEADIEAHRLVDGDEPARLLDDTVAATEAKAARRRDDSDDDSLEGEDEAFDGPDDGDGDGGGDNGGDGSDGSGDGGSPRDPDQDNGGGGAARREPEETPEPADVVEFESPKTDDPTIDKIAEYDIAASAESEVTMRSNSASDSVPEVTREIDPDVEAPTAPVDPAIPERNVPSQEKILDTLMNDQVSPQPEFDPFASGYTSFQDAQRQRRGPMHVEKHARGGSAEPQVQLEPEVRTDTEVAQTLYADEVLGTGQVARDANAELLDLALANGNRKNGIPETEAPEELDFLEQVFANTQQNQTRTNPSPEPETAPTRDVSDEHDLLDQAIAATEQNTSGRELSTEIELRPEAQRQMDQLRDEFEKAVDDIAARQESERLADRVGRERPESQPQPEQIDVKTEVRDPDTVVIEFFNAEIADEQALLHTANKNLDDAAEKYDYFMREQDDDLADGGDDLFGGSGDGGSHAPDAPIGGGGGTSTFARTQTETETARPRIELTEETIDEAIERLSDTIQNSTDLSVQIRAQNEIELLEEMRDRLMDVRRHEEKIADLESMRTEELNKRSVESEEIVMVQPEPQPQLEPVAPPERVVDEPILIDQAVDIADSQLVVPMPNRMTQPELDPIVEIPPLRAPEVEVATSPLAVPHTQRRVVTLENYQAARREALDPFYKLRFRLNPEIRPQPMVQPMRQEEFVQIYRQRVTEEAQRMRKRNRWKRRPPNDYGDGNSERDWNLHLSDHDPIVSYGKFNWSLNPLEATPLRDILYNIKLTRTYSSTLSGEDELGEIEFYEWRIIT